MNDVPEDPRRKSGSDKSGASDGSFGITVHGDLNYSPNDIAELRRLADDHPDLAMQLVKDRHKSVVIENNTERLGMALAVILGVCLVVGTTYAIVQLGWWQAIMLVGALLGISHILRTLLKGEFSETSWFGQILTNSPKNNEKGRDESS